MSIDSHADLEGLAAAGHVAAATLQRMLAAVEPGVTTAELDDLGSATLRALGARSAPMLAVGFPGATCVSVDEEIAHGVPGSRALRAGGLVNVDVSVELDGFWADCGASAVVPGGGAAEAERLGRLCDAGREALSAALAAVRSDALLNRIGLAVERVARDRGYAVIRDLCGHGVGRALHEEPGDVYGFYDPSDRRRMRDGMVLAVEPFLSTGSAHVRVREDGWTLATADGGPAVQFEHTIVVTDGGALVVTAPEPYLVEHRPG